MTCTVRPAAASDADVLSWLESVARGLLVDARGGRQLLDEQPEVGDWAALIADPASRVWVATIDDVVVGYLELRMPDDSGCGRVRQVFVEPDARELGFGDNMLAAAIAVIRAAGGNRVESFALPGDRDTKNLFERAAVTARKLIVSKALD